MTDKQIIDEMIERIGFDVQQCGYLKIIKDAPNYPEIGGTFTAFECNLYSRDCDFIERCRYKQLLRKEQECEELKEDRERWKSNFNGKVSAIEELLQKLDQLKKTLAEIKEIAETYKMTIKKICGNCKKYDDCHACCYKDINCYKYTSSKTNACEEFTYLDELIPNILANNILQKISDCEVKNE